MSFTKDIQRFTTKTEKAATMIFRGTALDLFGVVIKRTPVLIGRLAGNWQTQINSAASGVTDDKGRSVAESKAKAVTGKAKLGDSIYLTNNLVYADVIENGDQHRTGVGMVKVTVSGFKAHVAKNARKNK